MKIKLLALLLLAPMIGAAQKITLSASDQPIKTVFELLQSKSRYYVLYSDEVVPDSMRASVRAEQLPVTSVMDQLLKGKNLGYQITEKGMIIITKPQTKSSGSPAEIALAGAVYSGSQPVPFASLTLFKDQKALTGAIADEDGRFNLQYVFFNQEKYVLQVSAVGYQLFSKSLSYPDTAWLRHIELTEETRLLHTVQITAQRPLVLRKSDRYIVNVEGSFLENGFSGLEVLQRSPGIWVSSNGTIRLKGDQSVMVMINDVVQRMSSEDLAEYLRALKSESISKIEVISNPPSENEASSTGGIIHIIMKKSRSDGLVSTLSANYRQQKEQPFFMTGGMLDSKANNLYLFGHLFLTSDESKYIATYHIVYPDNSLYNSFTNRYNHNQRLQYRLGAAYDLGKKQFMSIQTVGNASKLEQSFLTDIHYNDVTGFTDSRWLRRPDQNSTTFNYVWKIDTLGSTLKVIGDYAYAHKTELNQFNGTYSDPVRNSIFRVNTPNTTNIYSFQTDYTKVLPRKLEFKTGLKLAITDRDNDLINEDYTSNNWVLNQSASNRFLYRERLYMGYASLEKSWKLTSLKAGLRGEETLVDGNSVTSNQQFHKNYFGLFPSFFINQTLNAKTSEAIHFSYARRLQRPAFKELNPYRLQFDNFITIIGNPDLLPQYSHNFELGMDFNHGSSANIYFTNTSNTIAQFAQPYQNNILEYQFRNFDRSTEYGANVNVPVKPAKWWDMNNSLSCYHLSYLLLNGERNSRVTFAAKTSHTFMFPKLFDLGLYSEYRSPYVSANTRFSYVFYNELGISRRFLKDRRARLSLYVEDIFNNMKEQEKTYYNNTNIDFYQKRPTRVFSLQFSYTIRSGKKFANKKIDQSNNEEKNRL